MLIVHDQFNFIKLKVIMSWTNSFIKIGFSNAVGCRPKVEFLNVHFHMYDCTSEK